MIFDVKDQFCYKATVNATSAADSISTDYITLPATTRKLGPGIASFARFVINTAFGGTTLTSVVLHFQDSPDASSWTSRATLDVSGDIASNLLAAGKIYDVLLPKSNAKYIRVKAILTGSGSMVGAYTAFLMSGVTEDAV